MSGGDSGTFVEMGNEMSEELPEPSCPNSNCQSLNVVYESEGWYECQNCGEEFKLPLVGEREERKECDHDWLPYRFFERGGYRVLTEVKCIECGEEKELEW